MAHVSALRCRSCSREYPVEPLNVCDFCFGPLEVVYDYDAIARVISRERIASGPVSMLRYHDLLPIDIEDAVEIEAGFTPLVKCNNLGRLLGLENLYVKNDSVNPTFSFKDRGGHHSGNQSPRVRLRYPGLRLHRQPCLQCCCACGAGRDEGVRFHSRQPRAGARWCGAAIYNPTLIAVDGSYDEVNRLCSEIGDNYPWAFPSTSTFDPSTPRAARPWLMKSPNSSNGAPPTTRWCPPPPVPCSPRYGRGSRSSRTLA